MRGITLCVRSASASSSAICASCSGVSMNAPYLPAMSPLWSVPACGTRHKGDTDQGEEEDSGLELVAQLVLTLLPLGHGSLIQRPRVAEPIRADRDGHLAVIGARNGLLRLAVEVEHERA